MQALCNSILCSSPQGFGQFLQLGLGHERALGEGGGEGGGKVVSVMPICEWLTLTLKPLLHALQVVGASDGLMPLVVDLGLIVKEDGVTIGLELHRVLYLLLPDGFHMDSIWNGWTP